jgi:hypothetical protein
VYERDRKGAIDSPQTVDDEEKAAPLAGDYTIGANVINPHIS